VSAGVSTFGQAHLSATAMSPNSGSTPVMQIEELTVRYAVPRGQLDAVDRVSLELHAGELIGLVGESGCGKSTLAYALMNMVPEPGSIAGGRVLFGAPGVDVTKLTREQLRRFRWKEVAMVFQSALNTLNPVMRVGDQVVDIVRAHEAVPAAEALDRGAEGLRAVRLDPNRVLQAFPHELSGGMKQRVSLMLALLLRPKLLILDEPTTALDVLSQRAVLAILTEIQRSLGLAMLFITHDLSLIAEISDRVGVMYAGRLVELGPTREVFRSPRHPYTKALLKAVPSVTGDIDAMEVIPGMPPDLVSPPAGCRFSPRCPLANERCVVDPTLAATASKEIDTGHLVACHNWEHG